MGPLIEILKSRGKLGGVALMLIGLAQMVLIYFGKMSGTYQDGATTLFLGLGILGIRGAVKQ